MRNEKLWIWMQLVFGAANPRVWSVLNQFSSVEDAYVTLKSGEFRNISEMEAKAVLTTGLDKAEAIIAECKSKGYSIVTYDDDNYPNLLKSIFNAPVVLYCMGNPGILNSNIALTVVGTRKPSQYSINAAQRICAELSKVDVIIVSGFALGIDSMAHQAALRSRGSTVAVLGCGLNADYPRDNSKMKKVIAVNGAVITEYFPDIPPDGINFPKRNRILSGLSMGTLVVEAANGSGSLITAEYAIEQGRDVFCVPPANIFDNRYAGVIKYLRDGAVPTFSHLDIIYEYYTAFSHKLSTANMLTDYYEQAEESAIFSDGHGRRNSKTKQTKKEDNQINHEKMSLQKEKKEEHDYSELDKKYLMVIKMLETGIKYADEISEELGIDITELFSMLTDLEISGFIRALPGKAYELM